jgi:hypothetical protein
MPLACDVTFVCFLFSIFRRYIDGSKSAPSAAAAASGRLLADNRANAEPIGRIFDVGLGPSPSIARPVVKMSGAGDYADWRAASQFRTLWCRGFSTRHKSPADRQITPRRRIRTLFGEVPWLPSDMRLIVDRNCGRKLSRYKTLAHRRCNDEGGIRQFGSTPFSLMTRRICPINSRIRRACAKWTFRGP